MAEAKKLRFESRDFGECETSTMVDSSLAAFVHRSAQADVFSDAPQDYLSASGGIRPECFLNDLQLG
jgi:hypothetical protein